jgi:hypothetical protein
MVPDTETGSGDFEMKPRIREWRAELSDWYGYECRSLGVYGYGETIERAYESYQESEAEWMRLYGKGKLGNGPSPRLMTIVYRDGENRSCPWEEPKRPTMIQRFTKFFK